MPWPERLAPEPEVVLLDEPFSNLDAPQRDRMRREVRQILVDAGATAVFVTHDQEEALAIADVVAVMRAGEIVQFGIAVGRVLASGRSVDGVVPRRRCVPGRCRRRWTEP